MNKSVLFFVACLFSSVCRLSFAEDVRITTYYPSPYGSYKHLSVEDGATNTTSYGSLQIVRQENNHLGSHIAFIRDATTPKVMGLGYKQSSDTFGFGPGVDSTTAFDPGYLSIDSSGNVGIGTNNPSTKAGLEVAGSKPLLIPRFSADPVDEDSADGMVYYNNDSGTNKFRIYQNGVWTDMAAGGLSTGTLNRGFKVTFTNGIGTVTPDIPTGTKILDVMIYYYGTTEPPPDDFTGAVEIIDSKISISSNRLSFTITTLKRGLSTTYLLNATKRVYAGITYS